MGLIVLVWFLNFGISWLNAWGCGKSWKETKHLGGVAHFMNWMGAIMSASGFTWCYTLLGCLVAGTVTHNVNGHQVPFLSPQQVEAMMSLGYLVVIFPILGSGLAITIHSWVAFARRRSFANGALAGYNTFADLYNMYSAFQQVPSAWGHVTDLFSLPDADEDAPWVLVVILVVAAFLAGILTTYTILSVTAENTIRERALRYACEEES